MAFLCGLLQALQRLAVIPQIYAVFLLKFGRQFVDDALVKVVAAQECIAAGGTHLKHTVTDIQDRDVEGAAAEVVDGDHLILLLVQPVRQRRGRRLIDDAQHLKSGDLTRILGGIALCVVEVGRYRDHGLCHRLTQVRLCVCADLGQDHGRDLGGAVVLPVQPDADIAVGRPPPRKGPAHACAAPRHRQPGAP